MKPLSDEQLVPELLGYSQPEGRVDVRIAQTKDTRQPHVEHGGIGLAPREVDSEGPQSWDSEESF